MAESDDEGYLRTEHRRTPVVVSSRTPRRGVKHELSNVELISLMQNDGSAEEPNPSSDDKEQIAATLRLANYANQNRSATPQ